MYYHLCFANESTSRANGYPIAKRHLILLYIYLCFQPYCIKNMNMLLINYVCMKKERNKN